MTNIWTNPSVEVNLDGFTNFGDTGSLMTRSTDWAQDGDYSIKMVHTGYMHLSWSLDAVITPDTDYVWSAYVKGSGSVQLMWRTYSDGYVQHDSFTFSSAIALTEEPQWVVQPLHTTHPDTWGLLMGLYADTPNQTWYADWIQLELGTEATPYPSSGSKIIMPLGARRRRR